MLKTRIYGSLYVKRQLSAAVTLAGADCIRSCGIITCDSFLLEVTDIVELDLKAFCRNMITIDGEACIEKIVVCK